MLPSTKYRFVPVNAALLGLMLMLGACGTGCEQRPPPLRLAAGASSQNLHRMASEVSKLWARERKAEVQLVAGTRGSIDNLRMLMRGKADMALTRYDPAEMLSSAADSAALQHLHTVAILSTTVFYILHKQGISATTLPALVHGRRVRARYAGSGTAALTRKLFSALAVDTHKVRIDYLPPEAQGPAADVIFLTKEGVDSTVARLLHGGYALWGLDDPEMLGKGSTAEGFCTADPFAHPHIIARHTYGKYSEVPVLTLAVHNELVASETLDAYRVYDLVETLYRHKEWLSLASPSFTALQQDLRTVQLSLPLHAGTLMYLNRDQPTFLHRNGELIGLALTVLTLVGGGLSALWQRRRAARKNRVDKYYLTLVEIEQQLDVLEGRLALVAVLERVQQLRNQALTQLADEQLAADDSFLIFMRMVDQLLGEIKSRLKMLNT